MAQMRTPLQGVSNVVRFNRHFYLLALAALLIILLSGIFIKTLRLHSIILFAGAFGATLITLLVTYYVYDWSGLYDLFWLDDPDAKEKSRVLNINAGFDETSALLADKFKGSELMVFDFYDSKKHTEISIKRARRAYPPYPNTKQITTSKIPLGNESIDKVFAILSLHEIRNREERNAFFQELHRILKPDGRVFVTEHLRDAANFLAYNVGFFHFHSKKSWLENFQAAQLVIEKEIKITPFLTTFVLKKYDSPS
jgi:ubiquinone/menaquinone biosynthesis C-methylase UbiE